MRPEEFHHGTDGCFSVHETSWIDTLVLLELFAGDQREGIPGTSWSLSQGFCEKGGQLEGRGHWLKALSPIAVVHNCEANTCVIHPWNPWFALSVMLICTAEHLGSGRRYSHSPGADTDPWSGPCSRTGMVEAPGVSHKHDHLYWWPMDDLWMTYGWPMVVLSLSIHFIRIIHDMVSLSGRGPITTIVLEE